MRRGREGQEGIVRATCAPESRRGGETTVSGGGTTESGNAPAGTANPANLINAYLSARGKGGGGGRAGHPSGAVRRRCLSSLRGGAILPSLLPSRSPTVVTSRAVARTKHEINVHACTFVMNAAWRHGGGEGGAGICGRDGHRDARSVEDRSA